MKLSGIVGLLASFCAVTAVNSKQCFAAMLGIPGRMRDRRRGNSIA
jgi:hypothetical protein